MLVASGKNLSSFTIPKPPLCKYLPATRRHETSDGLCGHAPQKPQDAANDNVTCERLA